MLIEICNAYVLLDNSVAEVNKPNGKLWRCMHTCYEHVFYSFLQVVQSLHVAIINHPLSIHSVSTCKIHGLWGQA